MRADGVDDALGVAETDSGGDEDVDADDVTDDDAEGDTVAEGDALGFAEAFGADGLASVVLAVGSADGSMDASLDGFRVPTRACIDNAVSEGVGCSVAASDVCAGDGTLEAESLGVSSALVDGVEEDVGLLVGVELEESELLGEAVADGVLEVEALGGAPSTHNAGIPLGIGVGSAA